MNGSPTMAALVSLAKLWVTTRVPGKDGMAISGSNMLATTEEPHQSQCGFGSGSSLWSTPVNAVVLLQRPLSLPVCTSFANMDEGVTKPDRTARNANATAMRPQKGSGD